MSDRKGQRHKDDLLDWFTVSYRSIFLVVSAVLVLGALAGYAFYTRHAQAPPVDATPPPAGGSTARFRTLEGSVKVKPVGTFEWVPATTSTVLRKSDLVRTGTGSAAEIAFFDGTIVHVRPDSLITIEETAEDPSTKQRKVAWHISSGEVNFQTVRRSAAGSAAEISTPTVRSMSAGEQTEGGIRVAESGDSDVRIWKGTGQVETRTGERVNLGPAEAVAVDVNGKAAPKKVLPPVPTLLAPPHQAEITYPDPSRATTMLAWKAVPGATSYHVMLDYSAYFNRPIVDRGGITDSSVQLQGLDTGKYYWRVAAVDREGVEGAYSEFARFTVVRRGGPGAAGGPPPPLAIQELELRTNILQIKGRTEPGATVTVNGQRVDVQNDGSFNEFITLDKPGRQTVVVRATGLAGGVIEQRRQVVVAD